MKRILAIIVLLSAAASGARATEADARRISERIRDRHMPHGTILDPLYAAPGSDQIVSYARAGDSAIWTGHYLAAESFRYAVTRSPEALEAVRRALDGVRLLVDVTDSNLLARCVIPADSLWAAGIIAEEGRHGAYTRDWGGRPHVWFGNTSRDQYSGVFFGLGVAYDVVNDAAVRAKAGELISRMLSFLLQRDWSVRMPDGTTSTTFLASPLQRLNFLQLGRQVDPDRYGNNYDISRLRDSLTLSAQVLFDINDVHESYFKFNLATISFYHLIRFESSDFRGRYVDAYDLLRRTTDGHGNAHFNLVDRALKGPDERRDTETRLLLKEWLRRPARDEWLDWRQDGRYPPCGPDRACEPIPVTDRIRTDFLWQRSPFLLWGGGYGTVEGNGIDYILPYWMARYYEVLGPDGRTLERGPTPVRPR